jgi:hypothetical protein
MKRSGGEQWGERWGPVGRKSCAGTRLRLNWDSDRTRQVRARRPATDSGQYAYEKRGSRWLPRCARRFRYSSKRRRNRSSIRLVKEPPPLLRRWRADPGAEPEASDLPDNRGPVMA